MTETNLDVSDWHAKLDALVEDELTWEPAGIRRGHAILDAMAASGYWPEKLKMGDNGVGILYRNGLRLSRITIYKTGSVQNYLAGYNFILPSMGLSVASNEAITKWAINVARFLKTGELPGEQRG